MRQAISIISGLAVALAAVGCDRQKPGGHAGRPRMPTTLPAPEPDLRTIADALDKQDAKQPGSARPSMPAGHPPVDARPSSKSEGALPPGHPSIGAQPPDAASGELALKFNPPSVWKQTPVASAMRKAQFVLPKAAGDSEDGQLVVFYFGKDQGGTVEMNIDRWKGMFSTPDGKPVGDDAVKRQSIQVSGMKVTLLDVHGRYSDQMGRPNQPGPTQQDFRMLAAIVETPDGPWFFKAVGPVATMSAHASAFDEFVRSIHQ